MNIATDKAFAFTEARIEEAIRLIAAGKVETDNEGRRLWRDSGDTHGLYLRASASGGTYYRISKKAGRKQKKRIGDALTMRVSTARAEALKLASGDNSAGAAPIRVRTDGPTVAQAWSRYIADTKSGDFIAGRKRTAPSTIASYEDLYAPHLSKQYGNKSLHALAKDVHNIHRRLRDKPATANRLLQVISNLFVHAARAGYWVA
jgi:hypothetical protein